VEQERNARDWIPACAGMTDGEGMTNLVSRLRGKDEVRRGNDGGEHHCARDVVGAAWTRSAGASRLTSFNLFSAGLVRSTHHAARADEEWKNRKRDPHPSLGRRPLPLRGRGEEIDAELAVAIAYFPGNFCGS